MCGCIQEKVVVLGQKWLHSGKSCFIRVKLFIRAKVVVFGYKLFYSGEEVVFG